MANFIEMALNYDRLKTENEELKNKIKKYEAIEDTILLCAEMNHDMEEISRSQILGKEDYQMDSSYGDFCYYSGAALARWLDLTLLEEISGHHHKSIYTVEK